MEDEEYKKLPVEEKCVHKLWKARVNGYEEVTKLFRQIDDEKSPEFGKYLGLVRKFVVDSNAMGQEKGLEATLAYVENYAHAGKTVSEVVAGIVLKCIAAPKTRTRELALQVVLMYVEIEKQEAVMEELVKGMEQKNPKIVAACIMAATTALRDFGSKIVNVKPLVKKITPLFADRDKTVRDEARQMVVEIFRWIGAALRSQLNNLQPVQITELEAEFVKIEGQKAIPTRYVRSQQQKQVTINHADADEVADDGANDEGDDVGDAPQMDPYDLADPVDILSKLPKDFYEKIEAKKWQERKEVLEVVETLLKAPKLENGDYGDLVRALKKVVQKDSNVVVVALAGRCIASLATGLKKRFGTYAGACVPALLEKFKEKKQNVVTAMREAIDAVYLTTNIEAILDDAVEAMGNKNPSVKLETSFFLARAFTKTNPSILNKKILKALTTGLSKNINEPDPAVRDSAAEALGTLMKLVGEKAIGPFLVDLEKDNLKMTKIKECCEKAVITVKTGGGGGGGGGAKKGRPTTAPAKPAAKTAPPTRSASQSGSATITKKKAPDASSRSAPAATKPKGGGGGGKAAASSKGAGMTKTVSERELGDEEVDEIVSGIISESTRNDMEDVNWKTRLEAAKNFLDELQNQDALPAQALVRAVVKKPGLKDTNIQVLKAKLDIVKYVAEKSPKFSTTTANCCINDIAEKFGDAKIGVLVAETMTAIAEATSLGYVSTIVLEIAAAQKNPKVLQETLTWLGGAIKEFGFANLNAKFLIETAKKALASTNPGVRQSAIAFCGILYLYMGNTLHMFFENEKPVLREQITAEFDKYEGETPPTPTRGVVRNAASTNSLDALEDDGETESVPSSINVQDLLPRVDISVQMTDALIAEVEDKNWKVRNEALTKISAILQEAKFIRPNLGDLPVALSHRLSDSNTKIAQSALNICEAIAKAMGPPCKQYIRTFFPCFLQNLGDNKNWMRTTAIDTINAYADQCGHKEFFEAEMIADALKSGSPMLRIELWAWLAEKVPKIPVKTIPKEELTACIPHLYSNLEDRNVDVRKNAQEAVLGVMIHLGYENMAKHTEKLSLGSKKVVVAALDKARPYLPLKPLPKKPSVDKEDKAVRGTKSVANSKTVVKPKGSAGSTKPTPVSSGRKKDDDLDTSPLLVVSNLKHQRMIDESKLKVLKWNFTAPREEFVEQLNLQMATANVNKTLMSNMFHNDFRYHIKAIESLMDDLPANGPAIISNLDLILKWLTLRFFDTNPSVLLKGFEFLHLVFNMLIDEKYHMLENEASSFLPYLIVKIGDPKDAVRNGVRSLFKQMYFVYPLGRLFSYIMDGLKSKNARQRAECLDAMGSMIQDYGVTVCSPGPAQCLKEVAKQISDRDNSVRNAALNCVVEAYNIIGDKVYKMVGHISDKDLSLLEERIKRSSRKTMKPPAKIDPVTGIPPSPQREQESRNGIGDGAQQQQQQQPEPEMTQLEDEEEEAKLPPVIMPTRVQKEIAGPYRLDPELLQRLDNIPVMPNLAQVQEFDLEFLNNDVDIQVLKNFSARAKTMPMSPPKPIDLNLPNLRKNVQWPSPKKQEPVLARNIQQMSSADINVAIQAIEQVIDFLQTPKSSVMLDFENDFMSAIVTQLRQLRYHDPRTDANVSKIYRNLLTVIDAFYRNKSLGKNVNMEVLKDIINELITLLVDEKLDACTDGDAYVRVVNLQCVKFIERSDHTRVICALVQLIHECVRHDMPSRHTDLVMKCIWRVIKQMPQREEVDYDMVLLYVHNFLKEFPTSWWKNKPLDTTLRTIKTILHSTVKIKGGSIMLHLGKIPNPSESEVESYLLKLLKTMKVDEIKQLPLKQDTHQRRSLSKATHTTLTEIFQKIGNKEETKEGITLLYDFLEQHPEADIDPFLKKSSKFFQDYIQNGLQEIRDVRKNIPAKLEMLKTGKTLDNASDVDLKEFQKGPEYWMKKLNMYKKMIDDVDKGVYDS